MGGMVYSTEPQQSGVANERLRGSPLTVGVSTPLVQPPRSAALYRPGQLPYTAQVSYPKPLRSVPLRWAVQYPCTERRSTPATYIERLRNAETRTPVFGLFRIHGCYKKHAVGRALLSPNGVFGEKRRKCLQDRL